MQKIMQYKTIISEIRKLKSEELKQFADKTQLANRSWDKKKQLVYFICNKGYC